MDNHESVKPDIQEVIDYLQSKRAVEENCRLAEAMCFFPNVRLHCNSCGSEEKLTIGMALQYIDFGWPSCCGEKFAIRSGYGVN
jgi:hypothetical protein